METNPRGVQRRDFLKTTTFGAAALAGHSLFPAIARAQAPSRKVVVGVIGASRNSAGGDGRGTELAVGLSSLPDVEVAWICDVDARNVPKAIESVSKKGKQQRAPKGEKDFRRILEDRDLDAVLIATPDHLHTPAAVMACAAGKHVYVEKPCSHNPREGELLVAAARKFKRQVQHGTQRRSWPGLIEAVEKLRSGAIGRILFAQCWYYGPRPSIGQGKVVPVPEWLSYDLWQGPAPERPFRDNLVHYNWHWFWHWGTGELGNNAVHYLDVLRWGMGLDLPSRVTCSGGKYRYPDDDQETPDTAITSYDFPNATITWEQRSWAPKTPQDIKPEMAFYGESGVLTIAGGGYTISDPKGTELAKGSSEGGNQKHLQNFIDAIRGEAKLNADIEEGNKSTLLSHLGNIAYRTSQTLRVDPEKGTVLGNKDAQALWSREYRDGWEPKV